MTRSDVSASRRRDPIMDDLMNMIGEIRTCQEPLTKEHLALLEGACAAEPDEIEPDAIRAWADSLARQIDGTE